MLLYPVLIYSHGTGVGLMMEGFMSAFYHICPSDSNYQFGELAGVTFMLVCNYFSIAFPFFFLQTTSSNLAIDLLLPPSLLSPFPDTAFMFIIAGLLLVKIFQNRHPDIHANAFLAFFSFAVVVFFALVGIVSNTLIVTTSNKQL